MTCRVDYRPECSVPFMIGNSGLIFKQHLRALQQFSSASDFQTKSLASTGDVTVEHKTCFLSLNVAYAKEKHPSFDNKSVATHNKLKL